MIEILGLAIVIFGAWLLLVSSRQLNPKLIALSLVVFVGGFFVMSFWVGVFMACVVSAVTCVGIFFGAKLAVPEL